MSQDLDQSVSPEVAQNPSEDELLEDNESSTWYWRCPECGETGVHDWDDVFNIFSPGPHGTQHAKSAFGQIVPLEMSDTPFTADTPPFEPLEDE